MPQIPDNSTDRNLNLQPFTVPGESAPDESVSDERAWAQVQRLRTESGDSKRGAAIALLRGRRLSLALLQR